jgi:hypothetical protein
MKKLITSMFLVLTLLTMTAGVVFAQGTTPITGTVQTVATEVNTATGETIVIVTLLDEIAGTTQEIKITLDAAETLGLVMTDPLTGVVTPTTDAVGKIVEIDPITVILEENTDEVRHPVGSALSDFFSGVLGADYETIMAYHDEGIGFGVIAQALWLSNSVDGSTTTIEALLDAKQSGDFSAITLADGSTPSNWGAVVKSLKKGENLGSVMSTTTQTVTDGVSPETTTMAPTNPQDNTKKGNGNENSTDKKNNKSNNGNGNGH